MLKRLQLLVLFVLLPSLLWANNNEVRSNTIHVGLIDSRPWAYHDDHGKVVGIYPDLLESIQLLSPEDIIFELNIRPLKRIIKEIKSEKSPISLTFMSYKPTRTEKMTPVMALYRTPFILVSREDNPISTLDDIKGKDVAMLLGGSGCPCLDESLPYQRIRLNHHTMGLQMLDRGRVDAVAGPSIRLYDLIEQLELTHALAPHIVYEWRSIWMWQSKIKKGAEPLMTAIQNTIQMLLNKGELTKLGTKHLLPSQAQFLYPIEN